MRKPSWLTFLGNSFDSFWRRHPRIVPLLVLALCVVAVLVGTGVVSTHLGGTSSSGKDQAWEFAYLDAARVNSYLGQLARGNVDSESLQEVTARSSGVGLEVSNVGTANASRSSQLTRNVVVTQTQADKFGDLLRKIKAQHPFHELDANHCDFGQRSAPSTIPTGAMVLIRHAQVRMPPYLSAYPELRAASYRLRRQAVFGAAPLYAFRAVDESVRGTPKRERELFKKTIGPNPRIPFTISTPYTEKEVNACKTSLEKRQDKTVTKEETEATVFLPARFARLTGDLSLLSRPLTIVGKVVSNGSATFGDGLSVSTYWPALSVAKAPLLRELGVRKWVLEMKRPKLREALFKAMARSLTFEGHVVEVLPIAMYD
jgi:hypothetical protein